MIKTFKAVKSRWGPRSRLDWLLTGPSFLVCRFSDRGASMSSVCTILVAREWQNPPWCLPVHKLLPQDDSKNTCRRNKYYHLHKSQIRQSPWARKDTCTSLMPLSCAENQERAFKQSSSGFAEIQNSQYPFSSPGMGPIWLKLKISLGNYKIKGSEAHGPHQKLREICSWPCMKHAGSSSEIKR